MNNLDNMEYSLQQYAAMAQAQLFHRPNTNNNTDPSPTQQQQDPNADFSLSYPSFSLIRMAPPQLHQPTLAKEVKTIEDNKIVSRTPIRVTRPPNAYLLFNKEMRRILKDQDPTMKVADISKEVGSRWKHMPKEQKDHYVKQANKLKEEQRALHPNSMYIRRSRAELVKAGHTHKKLTDTPPVIKKKTKRDKKNSTIPKHPLSAYMWYLTEVRPDTMRDFPGSNVGQISKLCADRWHSMSEEAKLPWKSKAQLDKDRYAREMQVYALQNDQHLGRGTRQKYRSAAAAAATATSAVDVAKEKSLSESFIDNNTSMFYDDNLNLSMSLNPNSLLHDNQ